LDIFEAAGPTAERYLWRTTVDVIGLISGGLLANATDNFPFSPEVAGGVQAFGPADGGKKSG
jgi:hypothetical protein